MKYRFFIGISGIVGGYNEIVEVPEGEDVEEYLDGWLQQNLDYGYEKVEE